MCSQAEGITAAAVGSAGIDDVSSGHEDNKAAVGVIKGAAKSDAITNSSRAKGGNDAASFGNLPPVSPDTVDAVSSLVSFSANTSTRDEAPANGEAQPFKDGDSVSIS